MKYEDIIERGGRYVPARYINSGLARLESSMYISCVMSCLGIACNGRRSSRGRQGEKNEKKPCGATPPRKDERSESFERILKTKMNGLHLQEEADAEAIRNGENPL